MIGEEYANHTCDPIHFKGIRDIEVTYWYESKHKDGQRMVFGLGSDGYTYRMIELKAGFEEIDPHQPTSNTNNNSREDNSTL
jgi:hypothetical protein